MAVMWCKCRCLCSGSCSTVICVARKPFLLDRAGDQPHAGQPQGLDARVERGQIDAGIDQRAERHVAADAAGTIEIGDLHGGSLSRLAVIGSKLRVRAF